MDTNLFKHWFLPHTSMWFVAFMHQALYHPSYGYYTTKSDILGKTGDFITAPLITPLFGETIAHACLELFKAMTSPCVLEFGPGTGQLCIDVLTYLEKKQALPTYYYLLEISPELKQRQQVTIKKAVPHLYDRIQWINTLPETPFEGVMLANEVLDAMPVHRVRYENGTLFESKIHHCDTGLVEKWEPCVHDKVAHYLLPYLSSCPTPYETEMNGMLESWLQQCSQVLFQGAMILIDYGFPAHEYFHPDRHMGTLMMHYQHQAHTNPLVHVGNQDITAHVDFSHVAECADKSGFDIAWFTNQASFLLDNGLLSRLPVSNEPKTALTTKQALHQLLSPSEMGELFKVMVLTKNCQIPSHWSRRHDQRFRL